jgi:hypothetical protein
MNAAEATEKALQWFEGPIKQSIKSVFDGINAGVESLDLFNNYHNAHIETLKQEVQFIKLLGMTQPSLLKQLYSPARVSTTIRRRLFTDEWISPTRNSPLKVSDTQLVAGDEFIEGRKRIAVLGGPGAGKTTFLKFLALSYSDKETFATTNLVNSLIPFFVALPVLARSNKEIFDFLLHPIKLKTNEYSTEYLRRILTKGYAVILLDSLDEVPISQRTQLLEKIRSFCGIYPNTKVVISCRTADYQGDMLDAFNEIEIAKLSKPAVGKIIKAWFTEEPERAKELVTIIENDTSISSLTETPLLLSLICIQFKHDLALPRRKVELFNRCSQTLLREWDTTRRFRRETAYQSLTDQAKERLFEEIAFHFTKEGLTFIFPKAATIQVVSNFCSRVSLEPSDAIGMLAEIDSHHGILEQFSQDHYGFSHTSFQDFFAARAISSRGLGLKYIQTNIDNSDWHSIFEFIVALEQDADPIVNFLVAKSTLKGLTNYPPMAKRTDWLRLLYRCLATGPYISPPTRRQALNHLVESQFEIARIYGEGGVYPLSQLLSDGIRHPYVYSHKRPSLSTALQPFRQFSNEILRTPIPGYAETVFESIKKIEKLNGNDLLKDALLLNLATPLASIRSLEVKEILTRTIEARKNTTTARIASVTLENIDKFSK